ncbi:protein-lysine methyltransferase METTL21C-like [Thalassophryne amazonica]|uniref:protein-lysine methyltransferase METTL21C-like n=1 Tax=Thalassophryne amazonica TaxID=390379 RepID=UPI001471AA2A|nr:protein-lysine methyltransferase METTL21C-like [Thalassophryne amazonica]
MIVYSLSVTGDDVIGHVSASSGASVTATDLPELLGNLRANVMRNTRGRCRYTPQVEELTWSYDLEYSHPTSTHHYDYVLATDVVYHHNYLDELLATMKHFCQPGTTVIWANKYRLDDDLTFMENFKKAFHAILVAEDGDIKIFMGSHRETDV